MRVQCLCQLGAAVFATVSILGLVQAAEPDAMKSPLHDYPTVARIEYVNACMANDGDKLAAMYQCACAIDRIADALSYEEYVEASTYAKYAALPGEGGAIFRDSAQARQQAKHYRELERGALTACGKRV